MKILIIKTSAIGDIILASGMVDALRARYPDAHISWCVRDGFEPLIENHPALDACITWSRGQWSTLFKAKQFIALFKAVRQFSRKLKIQQFDLVLDAQGQLKSGVIALLSGGNKKISLGAREGAHVFFDEDIPFTKEKDREQISEQYTRFLRQAGIDCDDIRMHLPVPDVVQSAAQKILTEHNISTPFITLIPHTTREDKHWQLENWIELVKTLRKQHQLPMVIIGGAQVLLDYRRLESLPEVISLRGKTSLLEAAAIVKSSKLVIGVDTGFTHLGTAYLKPTLCIWQSSKPYTITYNDNTVVHHPNAEEASRQPMLDNIINSANTLLTSR